MDRRSINAAVVSSASMDQADERRRAPRHRSFLRGKLYFNNRLQVVDCIIRDISDTGARLVYSEVVTTPDDIELHIPQKDQTLFAKVRWRRGQEVGVSFQSASEASSQPQPDQINDRLARLEAEVAELKRIIKKLKADTSPESGAA